MLIAAGSVSFDMMGKRLYETCINLTSIIVRISNGTPQGKEHGAADDVLCAGTMVDVIDVCPNGDTGTVARAAVYSASRCFDTALGQERLTNIQ